jgi:hypothetical protein
VFGDDDRVLLLGGGLAGGILLAVVLGQLALVVGLLSVVISPLRFTARRRVGSRLTRAVAEQRSVGGQLWHEVLRRHVC